MRSMVEGHPKRDSPAGRLRQRIADVRRLEAVLTGSNCVFPGEGRGPAARP